ncbi:MAG: hypothetical protein KC621_18765 [Myxococcales bacterium]|nr:hypothetical protein [Myxococcales bacterium]
MDELLQLSHETGWRQGRMARRRQRLEGDLLHEWRFGGLPRESRSVARIGVGHAAWSSLEEGSGLQASAVHPYGPSSFDMWYTQADRQHGRAEHFSDVGWNRPPGDESEAWSRLAGPTEPDSYHGVTGAWKTAGMKALQQEGRHGDRQLDLRGLAQGIASTALGRDLAGAAFDPPDVDVDVPPFRPVDDLNELPDDIPDLAICSRLAPPPWSAAGAGATVHGPGPSDMSYPIRECLRGTYGNLTDWPPADHCWAPCTRSMPLPTQLPQLARDTTANVRLVTDDEMVQLINVNSDWGWKAATVYGDSVREVAYFRSAVALLEQNIDIVEWAACTAASHDPRIPGRQREAIVDQIVAWISTGCNVYLFDHVLGGHGFGATDVIDSPRNCSSEVGDPNCVRQTGQCSSFEFPEGPGALASIWPTTYDLEPVYRNFVALDSTGGGDLAQAWSDLIVTASSLLHEFVHLAAERPSVAACMPGYATDAVARDPDGRPTVYDLRIDPTLFRCWRLQNQVASMFRYGMSRRLPDAFASVDTNAPFGPVNDRPAWMFGWSG